jgi:hypothetical protein
MFLSSISFEIIVVKVCTLGCDTDGCLLRNGASATGGGGGLLLMFSMVIAGGLFAVFPQRSANFCHF